MKVNGHRHWLTGISQCSETLSESKKNSQVSQKKNSQVSQKYSQLSQKISQTESFRTLWDSC